MRNRLSSAPWGPTEPNAAMVVPPFNRMARTHAASTAGDAMVATALAGTIFFAAASSDARDRTFLYLLLTMAPFAVVAPLIGPALDRARSGRRWIVIGSAVLRALLCFAMIGRTDSWLLYPAAFGILVIQKGYGIARSSLVPAVVRSDDELVRANSKLQLLSGLMGFVGAAPAALLFKIFDDSPNPALGLAVCTFAATAGLALRLPKVAVATASATPEERAEMRGVGVLLAAGATGLLRGIVGFLTLYFAFYFRSEDQLAAFGFVAAISVIGTLLGSIGAPKLRQVWPEERMLISVLVLTLVTAVLAIFLGGIAGAALLGFVVGLSATAGKLAFDSIVQRDAPDANRGRMFAKFETRFQLIWVVGAMLGLIPLNELWLSFTTVGLVAGFAAFSYAVGLTAWRHRTGAADSQFGPQAVLIDEAMAEAQVKARARVRTSTRALVTRVRTRGGRSRRVVEPVGPGVGAAVSSSPADIYVDVADGSPTSAAMAPAGAGDATLIERVAPTPAPPSARPTPDPTGWANARTEEEPTEWASPSDPTIHEPDPPPTNAPDADADAEDATGWAPAPDPTTFAPGPAPPRPLAPGRDEPATARWSNHDPD